MERKDFETLEYPKILAKLAEFTHFSGSRDLAFSLTPNAEPGEVKRRVRETGEARTLLLQRPDLTIGGARDVRPQVDAARRGAILDPVDLLDVRNTLLAAKALQKVFSNVESPFPVLVEVAVELDPAPEISQAIEHALSDRGEVLDRASAKLSAIRKDLRTVRERLTRKLEALLGDPKLAAMLQEPIITQRAERFVVPLKAEYKSQLESVIHDQSSSGATLFVEPLQVVEQNNQIRELTLAERDEVRRILGELSAQVGERAEGMAGTVGALAKLDLALAKARYADALGASEPQFVELSTAGELTGERLHLLAARHPLLAPDSVVPIDLILEPGVHALVITGPNTGGKTVTLKTAGLLALMAQSGLHLPAQAGSKIAIFDSVYADIGDEQSIEQSLSTFSSHITNIVRILAKSDSGSLVLLDELGAGTDPQEGSALAKALLEALVARGATTLVASHFAELKAFAHTTTGVSNASVEFDLETLSPTYHLTIGLPGRSNALSIAERLGLDPAIVARAIEDLPAAELRADSLLDDIHRQRKEARAAREEADRSAEEAHRLREELRERMQGIEEERSKILREARQQALAEADAAGKELRMLRRRLSAAAQPLEVLQKAEADLAELQEELAEPIELDSELELPGEEFILDRPLRPGDRVLVKTLDAEGILMTLAEESAEVQIGRLRLRAKPEDLRPMEVSSEADPGAVGELTMSPGVALHPQPPPLELHLRGQTVDEALETLNETLDAAFLSGMPFLRVIHGKGSGKLRQAIRHALKEIPYVLSFEGGTQGEGGEGVTIVHLEQS